MFRIASAAALCAAAALAVPAFAFADVVNDWAGPEVMTQKVYLTDAELHTVAGAKHAAFKLRLAAAHVCGGDVPLYRDASDFSDCRKAAIDRALAQIDSPLIAAALGHTAPTDLAQR